MYMPDCTISEGDVTQCYFTCHCCGDKVVVHVPRAGFIKRLKGAKIQDAFPDLKPEIRELFISGPCDTCFPKEETK